MTLKWICALSIILSVILSGTACNRAPVSPAAASPTPTPTAVAPTGPSPSPTEKPKAVPVEFQDVTQQAGLRFRHYNGAFGKKYLAETNGSGCAFIDYDNDGWQDIILINSMDFDDAPKKRRAVMALYHNNQDGSFTDVTAQAGLAKPMFGQGVAVGDYDNDGWDDIFVTAVGQNRLFRNLGNGKFADVTAKVGLLGPKYFSSSAAWFDYDKDGKLDLFVCNYVDWSPEKDMFCSLDGTDKSYCTPEKYPGQSSRLYHNVGGRFVDVTESAGIMDPTSKSLGVAILDYDKDGWPDVFVANDTQPNKLYHNSGHGTFVETAVSAGVAFNEEGKARGGMGTDSADIDGSGYPSIVVGNFSNEMLGLFRNQGKAQGLFIDEAPSGAIGAATVLSLTFGVLFFDYDLDGLPDILMANGHVADDINKVQPKITYAERPQLFRNEGKGKFAEVSKKAGKPFQRAIVGRGLAVGDFDNDGDLDILLTSNGGPAYLWRNEGGSQNKSVTFKTVGTTSNRDGIGARVTIFFSDGTRHWQVVHSGSSYCSQSQLPLTFGVRDADTIARAEIEWPSGKIDKLTSLTTNQYYVVKEGSGVVDKKPLPMPTPSPAPSPSPKL